MVLFQARGSRRRFSLGLVGSIAGLCLLRSFDRNEKGVFWFTTHNDARKADPNALHTYLENGHLEVNPNGTHPILELIANAQDKWRQKVERASQTLEEAVQEYKRRYKRSPPKGFDDWWNYVQEHNVLLPDEYDFIHNDLEPFWGISPEDLLKIQETQVESTPDTFTIAVNETHGPNLVHTAFSTENWEERHLLRGMDEILGLLKPIEHMLPPFRAIFSPHDNPDRLSDYHVKKAFLDAARAGKYINLKDLPEVQNYGWASACPPGSPARRTEAPINQYSRPPPRNLNGRKTFIHNHQASMDPCQNPYIFYHHAQYVVHDLGPRAKQVMGAHFSYCSTPIFHDIQPPTFISWIEDVMPRENDPSWEDKTDERLMWRGSNTGTHHSAQTRWIYAQRIHLVKIANELNGTERVLFPLVDVDVAAIANASEHQSNSTTSFHKGSKINEHNGWGSTPNQRVGEGIKIPKSILNPAMMDIAFTGQPIGCDPPSYCAYMETLFEWRRRQNYASKEAGLHKYLVDVDGNGWSSRFKRLITTNSLVFKATVYHEWWLDRIQPWVHYVPVQVDYSDLYDAFIFFRGGLYGEGNHDQLAKKIAYAGRQWSKAFWRKEDMTAYFFRLLLEYARVTNLDRESMSFDL